MPGVLSKNKHHTGNTEPQSVPASQRAGKEREPDRKTEGFGLSPVNAAFLASFHSSLLQWERNCRLEELMALRMAKRESSLKCGSAAMGSAQRRTAKPAQSVGTMRDRGETF